MPMHDWTRAETYLYPHFHTFWLTAICRVLNGGTLPPGFYALVEQVMRTIGPDVLALEASRPAGAGMLPESPGTERVAVADAPPQVQVVGRAPPRPAKSRQRRLSIRHGSNHRLVALVELVSPGNKSAAHPFRTFVGKAVRAIEGGIHLLVIDPFPPGRRDPNGIHTAIWEELGGDPYAPPAGRQLTLASYEAAPDGPRCYVEPTAVGNRLADMPLFLEPGYYVPVPLEQAYQEAFAEVPAQARAALEGP